MAMPNGLSRRVLLQQLGVGAVLVPLGLLVVRPVHADGLPLLSASSPEAKAVQYTEDAKSAKAASAGANCASCALYQGANGSAQGGCQLFPGKAVKASGWCTSWAGQM
jgi:hypothetical protein